MIIFGKERYKTTNIGKLTAPANLASISSVSFFDRIASPVLSPTLVSVLDLTLSYQADRDDPKVT